MTAFPTTRHAAEIARLEAKKRTLEYQVELAQDTLEVRKDEPIRIGLLGIRGACKSSLLAAWYLFGRDGQFPPGRAGDECPRIDLRPEESSMLKLKEIANDITKNGTATATANARPEIICFTLQVGETQVDLETLDFSGYFLGPLKPGDELRGLAEDSRNFIRECDVVLCLVNWNEDALETSDALDICFRRLQSRPNFIIGVTKFDEKWPVPSSPKEEEKTLDQCLAANASLAALRARIRDVFSRDARDVQLMLLAPLGGDFASPNPPRGKHPPLTREDLSPHNIHAPLRWALESRLALIHKMEQDLASLQEQVAAIDSELDLARRQESEQHVIALAQRLESLINGQAAQHGRSGLNQELEQIRCQAADLGEYAIVDRASEALATINAQWVMTQRLRLKERFTSLLKEIEQGGWMHVAAWHEALKTIRRDAEAIGDAEITDECATLLRRLGPQAFAAKCVLTTGLKTLESARILSIIALGVMGACIGGYVLAMVIGRQ